MPEGPEVRRAADRVERALVGVPTRKISFAFAHLRKFEAQLTGHSVTAVRTHGKAFLIDFASPALTIYVHLLLYGRWHVRSPPSYPSTRRSLRMEIATDASTALLYSASEIEVHSVEAVRTIPYLARLGPDCLDPALTSAMLMRRLANKRFARRKLAALYLDQSFVAGIGNYLRSEILFLGKVRPGRRPTDLRTPERHDLAVATRELPRRAYVGSGVTVERSLMRTLRANGAKRREYRHYVYGREGRPCHVCGASIEAAIAAGRRVYYCPQCQV